VTIWAIVPVKPLQRAKSRLAQVLSPDERQRLSRSMLIHTLEVLAAAPAVERTLVVSRDTEVLSIARDLGARTVTEERSSHLNRALARATAVARGCNIAGVLILPADLPRLTVDAVEAIVRRGGRPPVVVLAPDRRGQGTNALLCAPPGLIEYQFGARSFSRHQARALAARARLEVCDLPGLALDLDTVEDLEVLRSGGSIPSKPRPRGAT
jgi:2-phospho-L-lactate guanylyltransferase